jgi:hypothetical protein
LEFEFGVKPSSGWEGRVSYTLQESHSPLDGDPLSNSSRHLAKVNLIAPLLQKKLFASFEGQEISRRLTVTGTEIGGSFVANATLFSKDVLGKLRISASTTCSTSDTPIRWDRGLFSPLLSRTDRHFE